MKRYLLIVTSVLFFSCARHEAVSSFVHDGVQYSVEFKDADIVHICSLPEGDTLVTKRLVVDAGPYRDYRKHETGNEIVFRTSALEVVFDKTASSFYFRDPVSGMPLLEDSSRYFRETEAGGERCLEVTQTFRTEPSEGLYGLGQYQDGILNRRGSTVRMTHSNKDIANPVLVSDKGYGILWDNYSATTFSDDGESCSFVSEVGDASDYYFIYGGDMDGVVSGYRRLTGSAPMFGKWVFGFWQSKERYRSFDELKEVAAEYRRRGVPLDNIVQDWEYWGDKAHWNSLQFNPETFPDPAGNIAVLHNDYNVHVMLSVWPGFGPETEIYHALDSIGALFDEKTWAGYKVFDAYNPEAREIVWNHLKSGLYDAGVDAWWMDATEPSFRDGRFRDKQEERTKSAGMTWLGAFHRYLNTYSLEYMKGLYPHLRAESDDKRVFIFTRSAFASQQRYAAAVWSGDVTASWENMHRQLTAGLGLSVSGIPYWTSDTGGFHVSSMDGQYADALDDDDYKELYSRWFQFGAFTPVFRAHGTDIPREIWQFGGPGNEYYDNQVKYIRLRYSLMPYIYSLSYMVTADNYTIMRPLVMDFGADGRSSDVDYAYMFGPAFLVRPVFRSRVISETVRTWLPEHEGRYWYDFETGEVLSGGTEHVRANELMTLPLYVKGGSIVPMCKVKQWTTEYADSFIGLHVYAGADASFLWYDDEGDSYRYEDGFCSKVLISWDDAARTLTLGRRVGRYAGMPETVDFKVTLHLPSGRTVEKDVVYSGEAKTINL